MARYMTRYEEHQMVKLIIKKYSRDEAIVALNTHIKAIEFEMGILKSDLAEALAKKKIHPIEQKVGEQRLEIKQLQAQIVELKYQLTAHNIPLPKKYQ